MLSRDCDHSMFSTLYIADVHVFIIFQVSGPQDLQGPLYNLPENRHSFREIYKAKDKLGKLEGPVYEIGSPQHHYAEMIRNVESIKNLTGPVYSVEHVNQYEELIKHTEKLEKLVGIDWNDPRHKRVRPIFQASL